MRQSIRFAAMHLFRQAAGTTATRWHSLALVAASAISTAISSGVGAQQVNAPIQVTPRPRPVGDTSIFAPLVLPTANDQRAGSGAAQQQLCRQGNEFRSLVPAAGEPAGGPLRQAHAAG